MVRGGVGESRLSGMGVEPDSPERHGQGELHQVDAVDTVDFLHDCSNFRVLPSIDASEKKLEENY